MTVPSESAAPSSSSVEDLEDGFVPDGSSGATVDALEERVLRERKNPVLDVEEDADAAAVHQDPEHPADEAQPPVT